MLTVHEPESVSELPLEDAMLIKTYQRAITGGRRAGKKIVKMILEREKLRLKSRALQAPHGLRVSSNGTRRMRWMRSKFWALLQGGLI